MFEKYANILHTMVTSNQENYNLTKFAEEAGEANVVALQMVNKKGGPKEPRLPELVDELGDLLIRIQVLQIEYGIESLVQERVETKLNKYIEISNNGTHNNI